MTQLIQFAWEVAKEGYSWTKSARKTSLPEPSPGERRPTSGGSALVLSDGLPWELSAHQQRPSSPLKERTLFRRFAETDPTESGILAFATSFGLLGLPKTAVEVPYGDGCWGLSHGELLTAWEAEIRAMSETVRLWESAQGKDIGQLKKHVVWSGDAVGFRANAGHFRIALGPTHARLFRTGDLSGPARHLVQKLVNEKKLAGDVSAKLLWTDRPPRLGLHVCPASLLGALWLQFAQFLSEGRRAQALQILRQLFEVGLEASKATKLYCDDPCRMKNYRKRVKEERARPRSSKKERDRGPDGAQTVTVRPSAPNRPTIATASASQATPAAGTSWSRRPAIESAMWSSSVRTSGSGRVGLSSVMRSRRVGHQGRLVAAGLDHRARRSCTLESYSPDDRPAPDRGDERKLTPGRQLLACLTG